MNRRQNTVILLGIAVFLLTGCSQPTTPDDGTTETHANGITQNTVWKNDKRHVIEGTVTVTGAVLTIEAGTVVEFSRHAALVVDDGAGLIADGTSDTIVFTGAEAQAGWWQYIRFNENALDDSCRLTGCRIEYAGGAGNDFGAVHAYFAAPSLTGCLIRYSGTYGAWFYKHMPAVFNGNIITGCTNAPVRIGFSGAGAVGVGTYTGNGANVIEVAGGSLTSNAFWRTQDVPYLVHYGEILNGVLTLAPGCEVRMAADGDLKIKDSGGLVAEGTADSMITITGQVKENGSWRYIYFDTDAADSSCRLRHCTISYGGGFSATYGMVYAYFASPSIDSCHISRSASFGVQFNDCLPASFSGNRITACDREPVTIPFNGVPLLDSCDYTGNTSDYIRVTPAVLQSDAVWKKHSVPYLVEQGTIRNGTLTLMPGTELYMDTTASITVSTGGGLTADGTDGQITITGLRQTPGFWKHIRFDEGAAATDCVLDHCDISCGGGDPSIDGMLYCFRFSPAITNCSIRSSATWGIVYYETTDTQTGNIFSSNAFGNVKSQ